MQTIKKNNLEWYIKGAEWFGKSGNHEGFHFVIFGEHFGNKLQFSPEIPQTVSPPKTNKNKW